MVDVQRRQVLLSLAKGAASSSGTRSPHMYQSKSDVVNALSDVTTDASDASFFSALASPSPATSTASSSATSTSSVASPYAFAHTSLLDDDNLFAAYAGEPPQHELDGAAAWDLYYGAPTPVTPSTVTATMPVPTTAPTSVTVTLGRGAQPRSVPTATSSAPRGRQGVKRPLSQQPQPQHQQQQPLASPPPTLSVSVASSMLQMRNTAEPATKARAAASKPTTSRRTKKDDTTANAAIAMAAAEDSSCSSSDPPPAKKMKVSRERQLKINAASRRCRKKQKLELQFLRTHVVELQAALKDQVGVLKTTRGQQQKCAQLATFLEESIRQVEDMSSGGRPGTPKTSLFSESELMQLKATATQALAEAHDDDKSDEEEDEERVAKVETPEPCTVRAMDPTTGYYALSADRIKSLLHIASFMRNNISLESQSFSPEVISCLPIEMDGWQLRLAITEKNYTIHNCKFFPCNVQDLYDFCWATNVANKTSIKQGKNDYCVVTPLANDVAHVYSKTIGKWSLSVHGVANVSYNSLVCRTVNPETGRAMICQQSVLEDRDFEDESTIPWLFKRWVVFQPRVVDGVAGTFVEAYRTASYATGRRIYKEDNTYDSFCEHLIRRYAESNALLERMMARDPRFQHVTAIHHNLALGDAAAATAACDPEETTSDRMVKDLLLF